MRSQELPATPASAGKARRFVESVLTEARLDHLASTATLLVSELVANAVLHSRTAFRVVVHAGDDRLRVEVHDGSVQLPVRRHYSNMSATGRGLVLVDEMAADWGFDRTSDGKVVWFEVDGRVAPVIDILAVDAL